MKIFIFYDSILVQENIVHFYKQKSLFKDFWATDFTHHCPKLQYVYSYEGFHVQIFQLSTGL